MTVQQLIDELMKVPKKDIQITLYDSEFDESYDLDNVEYNTGNGVEDPNTYLNFHNDEQREQR